MAKVSCEVSVNVFANVSLVCSDDKQMEGDDTVEEIMELRKLSHVAVRSLQFL